MMAYKQNKSGLSSKGSGVRRLIVFASLLLTPCFSLFAADGPRLICGALSIASTTATWTPEEGCDAVELYTGLGNDWQSFRSPTVSVSLSVTNNARYDLFFYRSGNQIALQKGAAWASGSSRGTGAGSAELALQNGVWVNAVDISGLCAARLCRFAGTIQVDGAGAIALAQARLTGTFTAQRDVNIPDANSTTVVPSTATSQQFVTHIDANGVQQKAQPQNVTGTAAALAANGANCATGNAPLGVDASGAAEGCFDVVTPAELQSGAALYCNDAGANDTYTCSLSPALTAYTDGMTIEFRPNTTNTGAATLNINALGAKAIVDSANSTLADNALVAGRRYTLHYDGTSFRMDQDNNSGGGGSISGLTTGVIPKATSGSTLGDSSLVDCGSGVVSVGSCSGVPVGVLQAGAAQFGAKAAPATPGAGLGEAWVDSTVKQLQLKDDAGNVNTTVRTASGATANQFITHIPNSGIAVTAQPSFANLSGTASDAQIPHLNVLSTGLTANRCVETAGDGSLSVAASTCGTGGGGSGTPPRVTFTYSDAVQAVTANTSTVVALPLETYDDGGWHDLVTNNSRITFPSAQVCNVNGTIQYTPSTGDGLQQIGFRINGSVGPFFYDGVSAPGTATVSTNASFAYKFAANDYIELVARSTVNADIIANGGSLSVICGGTSANLTVAEVDGSPSVANVTTLRLPNGSLTDDGSGQVTFALPVSVRRRVCDIVIGDTTGSALTNGQLGPQRRLCYIPSAATLVEISVSADGGTPSVLLQRRRGASTVADLMSGALATAASGETACAMSSTSQTCIDGVTSSGSITLSNTALNAGDRIELKSGTAGGTAKLVTVSVIYDLN